MRIIDRYLLGDKDRRKKQQIPDHKAKDIDIDG
jgi:hypothetical protein